MPRSVPQDDVIALNGALYHVLGPVRVTNITVPPNPIVFGDTEKQGQTQVMQQFIQSNNIGGSGIFIGNPRTHATRHWKSRADTRFLDMLTGPPEVVSLGRPSGVTAPMQATRGYRGLQYFCFGDLIYYWAEASDTWTLAATLSAPASDMIVYRDKLYIAAETTYRVNDAGAWTEAASPAIYWTIWDNKLWKLYSHADGWMVAQSTDGLAWTDGAAIPADLVPGNLMTFRDANGSSVIASVTDHGLWLYDATTPRWYATEAYWPAIPSTQTAKGVMFRDGKLYATMGFLDMVSIQPGNPLVITPMGLNQDDGVPAEDAGTVVALASDVNYVIALVDGTQATATEDWLGSGPWESPAWNLYSGPMTLRFYFGGWHCLYEADLSSEPGRAMDISNSYGTRRLYFSDADAVRYMDLGQSTYNPRHNPTRRFQAGTVSHTTPWWHYGTEGQKKLHGHIVMEIEGQDTGTAVNILLRRDLNDLISWGALGFTTDGRFDIGLFSSLGLSGVYFQYEITITSTATASPRVRFYQADTMRLLPPTYGFGFRIDLSRTSPDGRTPMQQLSALKELADPDVTPSFYEFAYRDRAGDADQTWYGRITHMNGVEHSGSKLRGQGEYQIAFTAPYKQDAT